MASRAQMYFHYTDRNAKHARQFIALAGSIFNERTEQELELGSADFRYESL